MKNQDYTSLKALGRILAEKTLLGERVIQGKFGGNGRGNGNRDGDEPASNDHRYRDPKDVRAELDKAREAAQLGQGAEEGGTGDGEDQRKPKSDRRKTAAGVAMRGREDRRRADRRGVVPERGARKSDVWRRRAEVGALTVGGIVTAGRAVDRAASFYARGAHKALTFVPGKGWVKTGEAAGL